MPGGPGRAGAIHSFHRASEDPGISGCPNSPVFVVENYSQKQIWKDTFTKYNPSGQPVGPQPPLSRPFLQMTGLKQDDSSNGIYVVLGLNPKGYRMTTRPLSYAQSACGYLNL